MPEAGDVVQHKQIRSEQRVPPKLQAQALRKQTQPHELRGSKDKGLLFTSALVLFSKQSLRISITLLKPGFSPGD